MRLIKTLGLALTIALAAMALIGVGTASATELCKTEEEVCKEASQLAEGTKVLGTATKAEFITSLLTATCEKSTIEGKTMSKAGSPMPIEFTGLSFSGCKTGETACTVKTLHLPYDALLEQTAKDTGTLTIGDSGEGTPAATIECGGFVKCTLGSKELLLPFKGGEPGTIEASKVAFTMEGAFCPKTGSLTAAYKVEAPTPVHIVQHASKLCKVGPATAVCAAGNIYTGAINIALASKAEIKTALGTVTCEEAPMKGENFTAGGLGEITLMKFQTGGQKCGSTFTNTPVVAVTVETPPLQASFTYTDGGNAVLTVAENPEPKLKLKLELMTPIECVYTATTTNWEILSYMPMKIKSNWTGRLAIANASCAATAQLVLSLNVRRATDNGDLWVTR